jgi:uncharacterized membrane protein
MLSNLLFPLTLLAALGTGMMGGLFFAFSTSVMGAFARLPAPQGIVAMQSINVVILNPVFFVAFFGTALLCVVLAIAAFFRWGEAGSAWLLTGSILYLAGIILVTMIFNVPLNNALAAVDPANTQGAVVWTRYLAEWVPWNHVRAVAGLSALASFILAMR